MLHTVLALRRSPGFCSIVILALGLGVGVNSAIFSVIRATLFRSQPYPNPTELAVTTGRASFGRFLEWRQRLEPFAELAAYQQTRSDLTAAGMRYRGLSGCISSANLFHTLGVAPRMGRVFSPGEENSGGHLVIVGYSLWKETLGSDPLIVGKTVLMNGDPSTVVGVMPEGFGFPDSAAHSTEFWLPLNIQSPKAAEHFELLNVLVRARPGVSRQQLGAAMDAVSQGAGASRQAASGLEPLGLGLGTDVRLVLLLSWGGALLLLLLACGNVAVLQVARAAKRRGEVAVRLALGASRAQIVRALLLESTVLSAAAGVVGLLLAELCITSATVWLPPGMVEASRIHLDGRVLLFTSAVALLCSVLFGLAPALGVSKVECAAALRESTIQTGGMPARSGRPILVAFQTAITLTLLITTGLFLRTLQRLSNVPLGFHASHVLVVGLELPREKYRSAEQWSDFWERARMQLESTPGVERAGGTSALPFWGHSMVEFLPDGAAPSPDARRVSVQATMVIPGYFPAMNIRLISGRDFLESDRASRQNVVIVDRGMAARYWPGQNAVGKHVWIEDEKEREAEVVGIVDEIRQSGYNHIAEPTFYIPYAQLPSAGITFVIRTAGEPMERAKAVLAALHALEPGSTCYELTSMDQVLLKAVAPQRATTAVLAAFGTVALLAAVLGIYGFVAYTVRQRTREIGVRLAMGSRRSQAVMMVLRQTLAPVVAGLVAGLGISLASTHVTRSLLFGIDPGDPLTFVLSTCCLWCVAALAACAAAWKAATVSPTEALRYE